MHGERKVPGPPAIPLQTRPPGARPAPRRIAAHAPRGWSGGDLIVVVRRAERPFIERARDWPLETLPVDADLLVYTPEELAKLSAANTRFARVLREETRWIVGGDGEAPPSA